MYVQRNLHCILVQTGGAESCQITRHKYLIQNTNVTGSDFSQGCSLVGWQSHSLLFYAFRDINHVDEDNCQ